MMPVINGHVCVTAADARLARRGLDPQNPTNDPAVADRLEVSVGRAVMPEEAFDKLLTRTGPTEPDDAGPGPGQRVDLSV